MINYSQYKRVYAQPGLFYTLTGDYSGYVEVLSGVPYIDRTTNKLLLSSTFETSLITSTYFKNRTILDNINTLPYTERDVLFAANDFLTERLFKDKLTKLHDNNTFIYSKLFIANNDLPYNNEIKYGFIQNKNSTSITISTGYSGSIPFRKNTLDTIKALGNLINFEAVNRDINQDSYVIFGITSTQFVSITGNNTAMGVVEVSKYYESQENILQFSSLGGIAIGDNFAFITDTGNNTILKYDIAGYINGDSALGNKRNLIEILGGDGPAKLKTKFRGPREITSNGKLVVVHDTGNTVLKVFDTKFNYHSRITTIPLKKQPLASLQFNPHYNLLYTFTYSETNTKLNLYIYDLSAENKRPIIVDKILDIGITLKPGEVVQNIEFSKNSSEYYYICTNKNAYKLYITLPNRVVGRYQEIKLFNTETSTVNDTRVLTVASAPIITITPPTTFTTQVVTLCSTPDVITTVGNVINIPQIKDVKPDTYIFNTAYVRTDREAFSTTTPDRVITTPDTVFTTPDRVITTQEQRTGTRAGYTVTEKEAYSVTTPGYTVKNPIAVNASNMWSVVPIKFNNANWLWNGTYQTSEFEIVDIPATTTYFPAVTTYIPPQQYTYLEAVQSTIRGTTTITPGTTTTIRGTTTFFAAQTSLVAATTTTVAGLTTITPPTQITVPASVTIIPSQTFTRVQEQTTTIPGVTSYEAGEPYDVIQTSVREVETLTMFNDSYRGLSILPSTKNVDKIIFVTDGRIYFYEEPNRYKQIIKTENLQNYGITNIYTASEEYIQASTINKELYKVTRDIFAIKNNLVGRFNGYYDSNNVFTLNDYNYNINFNSFVVQEEEDYNVHENERTILGVMNRALVNILKLQQNLLEFTAPDTGSDLRPVFNPGVADTKALIID